MHVPQPFARIRPEHGISAVAFVGFALMTLLVATGATYTVDVEVRDALRPGDVWGPAQVRADTVVEGLEPRRTLPLFGAFVALFSWRRRSWRPAAYSLALLAAAGVPALVVKRAMARTDPHHDLSSIGSFPSGHVVVLLVCVGGAVLLVLGSPRWWQWSLAAVVPLSMCVALLLQAAHWFTDVLAGALLGVAAVLATAPLARDAARRPPRGRSARTPRPDRPRTGRQAH
jgi:membrane-associated phospholipid phosphatase